MRAGGAQLDSPAAGCPAATTAAGTRPAPRCCAPDRARRRVHPAAARPVGRRRLPDLPLPRRQRQLDRLRQLPHPADQRRAGRPGSPVQWDIWNEPNITLFWNRPAGAVLRAVAAHLPAHPRRVPEPPDRRPELRLRAVDRRLVDPVPRLRQAPTTSCRTSSAGTACPATRWPTSPTANTTLDSRGIPHPRPYQINEYGASNEQNPGDGSWYIARLERAGADGLRANWAGGGNLHNDLGNLLVRNSAGQHQPKGEWWVYRFYGSQTGQIASVTPSASLRRVRHQGHRRRQDPRRRRPYHRQHRRQPATPGHHQRHRAEQPGARASPSASRTTAAARCRARSPSRTRS